MTLFDGTELRIKTRYDLSSAGTQAAVWSHKFTTGTGQVPLYKEHVTNSRPHHFMWPTRAWKEYYFLKYRLTQLNPIGYSEGIWTLVGSVLISAYPKVIFRSINTVYIK